MVGNYGTWGRAPIFDPDEALKIGGQDFKGVGGIGFLYFKE